MGGGNICGQSKTFIFYPVCADMEIWLGQGGDFIRSPRFQWWRRYCSSCLWNIPISSLIFQTLAKQCYPPIRNAEVILSIGLLLSHLLKGKTFCRYLFSILNTHSGICGYETRGTTVWCCCCYVDFQRRMWAGLACGPMRSGVNWVISFWGSAGVIWTLYASIKCQKMDEKTYWKPDASSSCLLGHQKQAAQQKTFGFGRVHSQMSLAAFCLLVERENCGVLVDTWFEKCLNHWSLIQ